MTTTPQNGTVHADDFPLDSFRDATRHLRRPFTPAAVKFKVQATWPKDSPHSGLIVAYIDARLAVERLNLLVPHLWHDAYQPVGNQQMWCHLTIDGITRSDVGEGAGKGLVSDALKRAAVKFGIGVSLYAIPTMILKASDGTVKPKQTPKGMTLELQPKGEQVVRGMYEHWLDAHGRQAFGDPLDHGDVDGAQGDHEADDPPAGVDSRTGEVRDAPPPASAEDVENIRVVASDAGMSPLALLNVIRAVAGQEPIERDPAEVGALLDRYLERLPAPIVPTVLEQMRAEQVPA